MADPRACLLVSADAVEEEANKFTAGISPGRSTRSRAAAASDETKKRQRPPPPLPGKRAQKRILFEQIDDATSGPEPAPAPAPAPAPPPTPAPPRRYVCDWAQAVVCNFPELEPLKCQIDGCTTLVHHVCQGQWEDKEGHDNNIARLCCMHHPEYKYKHQPEKAASPPLKKMPARPKP